MDKITIKTPDELKIMEEGGQKLTFVKNAVKKEIDEGITAFELDRIADDLIVKSGGKPSFKMVAGYSWATCININDGLVHGIPKKNVVVKATDVVSVDMGLFYRGFHTDTSLTVCLKPSNDIEKFLNTGKLAFKKAIDAVIPGNRIYDISKTIQSVVSSGGYSPVLDLTGHGIGRNLHEEPSIPCFVHTQRERTVEIVSGMALAIEVMYAMGEPDVVRENDGWTISMRDGKISALFEDTVLVTEKGVVIATTS